MTRSDKTFASIVVTTSAAMMSLATVVPDWALSPRRLGVKSALLAPLAHVGLRLEWPDWIVLALASLPFLAFGIFVARGWIRDDLRRTVVRAGGIYGLAVAAALLSGGSSK